MRMLGGVDERKGFFWMGGDVLWSHDIKEILSRIKSRRHDDDEYAIIYHAKIRIFEDVGIIELDGYSSGKPPPLDDEIGDLIVI